MDEGDDDEAAAEATLQQFQTSSKRIAEVNKEWYSAMTKYGKSVEKVGHKLPTTNTGSNLMQCFFKQSEILAGPLPTYSRSVKHVDRYIG